MNWGFLLLAIGGLRLCLENYNKYGIRVDPSFWVKSVFRNVSTGSGEYPSLLLFICKRSAKI